MSSLLLSANPTSEPSKYIAQLPLVVLPSEVDVKARISSSFPVTPGTDGLPVVEIKMRPSGRTLTASMFSAVVSNPTSLPSRYMLNIPAVVLPTEVALNCAISLGVKAIPLSVIEVLKLNRNVLSLTTLKPKTSGDAPTSEPSKNRLQALPSNRRISSSANVTPLTVPLLENEAYIGLAEEPGGGVIVAAAVGVNVA